MKIHSYNEWDRLREVVVGRADHANWPTQNPVFALEQQRTDWKETPVPSGPVPDWIIQEANQDLESLCDVLRSYDVVVHRPQALDWQARNGFGTYSVRDRLLIAGDTVHFLIHSSYWWQGNQLKPGQTVQLRATDTQFAPLGNAIEAELLTRKNLGTYGSGVNETTLKLKNPADLNQLATWKKSPVVRLLAP